MAILWKYLIRHYLLSFLLIFFSFIFILLIMRSQEIASFTAIGSSLSYVFLYILYQVPFLLPIAIPVSSLIAAYLLMQKLSLSHELTAMRALGISLKELIFPLYLFGFILFMINLFISSEITPYCRRLSKELSVESKSFNPLILIQKNKLLNIQDSYTELNISSAGKTGKDLLFAFLNTSEDRITLVTADVLKLKQDKLIGKNISIISTLDGKKDNQFDHLTIENDEEIILDRNAFSRMTKTRSLPLHHDHLSTKFLILKWKNGQFKSKQSKNRVISEIFRHLFISFSPFTFTMIGCSFGFSIGRRKMRKGLFWAIGLSSFLLLCFLSGKSFQNAPYKALIAFTIPQILAIIISFIHQKKLEKGIEL